MGYLDHIATKIPRIIEVMLTVFTYNERAVNFYKTLGYKKDEFSPLPRVLRDGTTVEVEYLILSKKIIR